MSETVQELRSSYPPFRVWIEVDGHRVDHYSSQGDGNKYSAFIESVAGSSWALCYHPIAQSPDYDFTVSGYVDGGRFEFKSWEGGYHALKLNPDDPKRTRKLASTRVSATEERALVFSKVELGPSAFSDGDQRPRPEIGTISLAISIGKVEKPSPGKTTGSPNFNRSFLNQAKVEEGSVDKSISDRAAMGAAHEAKPRVYQTFKANNPGGEPDLTFDFYYRSKSILERDGHIKPAPLEAAAPAPVEAPLSSTPKQENSEPDMTEAVPTPVKHALNEVLNSGDKPLAGTEPKPDGTIEDGAVNELELPLSQAIKPDAPPQEGLDATEALLGDLDADKEAVKSAKVETAEDEPKAAESAESAAKIEGESGAAIKNGAEGVDLIDKVEIEVEESQVVNPPASQPAAAPKKDDINTVEPKDEPKPDIVQASLDAVEAQPRPIELAQASTQPEQEPVPVAEAKTETPAEPEVKVEPKAEAVATEPMQSALAPAIEEVVMDDFAAVPPKSTEPIVQVDKGEGISSLQETRIPVEVGKRKLEDGAEGGAEGKKVKVEVEGGAPEGGVAEAAKVENGAGEGKAAGDAGVVVSAVLSHTGPQVHTDKVTKEEGGIKVE